MQPETILYILVLVYSIILHEAAHGYGALLFGDKTAFYNGRLTLNPIPHIDLTGSIILPAVLILSGSPILAGWAKPVPVNESNLHPRLLGSFVVSIAGVLTNIALAVIMILLAQVLTGETTQYILYMVALVNAGLAIFNLIPVPPTDGYRVLSLFLPYSVQAKVNSLINQYQILFLIASIIIASFIFSSIFPVVRLLIQGLIF
jgi:Zn-dependent protease